MELEKLKCLIKSRFFLKLTSLSLISQPPWPNSFSSLAISYGADKILSALKPLHLPRAGTTCLRIFGFCGLVILRRSENMASPSARAWWNRNKTAEVFGVSVIRLIRTSSHSGAFFRKGWNVSWVWNLCSSSRLNAVYK